MKNFILGLIAGIIAIGLPVWAVNNYSPYEYKTIDGMYIDTYKINTEDGVYRVFLHNGMRNTSMAVVKLR